MTDEKNYWETEYDEAAKGEGGSGGIVALCLVSAAFKTYASGVKPVDDLFTFTTVKEKELAKAKAKKFSEANNGKGAKFGIGIVAYKDGAFSKGQEVTWQNDRVFFTDDFTDACKKVVRPALAKLKLTPGKHWLRLGFTDDPFGTKEHDANGNERTKQIAYPVEVFKNESAAKAAALASGSNGAHEEPDGPTFSADMIKTFKKNVKLGAEKIVETLVDDEVIEQYGKEACVEAVKAVLA